jgi:hypothetical protein
MPSRRQLGLARALALTAMTVTPGLAASRRGLGRAKERSPVSNEDAERLRAKRKAKRRARYLAQREKVLAQVRAYRAANWEKRLAYEAADREANKEQLKAAYKAYHASNRERRLAAMAARRAAKKQPRCGACSGSCVGHERSSAAEL